MPQLFPYRHNWSSPLRVESEYKTEIIESRAKREQRLALRTQPRKKLSLSITVKGTGLRNFFARMAAQQQQEWAVLETTRAAVTDAPVAAGLLALEFAGPRPLWASVGAYCGFELGSGSVLFQIATVLGRVVGFVIVDGQFDQDLPSGSRVYPALIGRLDTSIRGALQTNTVGTFPVVLNVDPGRKVENESSALTVFNGRELFLLKPNWRQTPQLTLESNLETMDFSRGRVSHSVQVDWNTRTVRMEFLRRNQTEVEVLTNFFHRMKGQQGEFYMPTWTDDIDVSLGAISGSSVLRVPGTEMADLYAGSTIYRSVVIFFRDGTYQVLRVNALVENTGDSRFTFASPFAQNVNLNTVKIVCWLPVWRLAIDALTLDWVTQTVAQAQLTMRTLEDL